MASSDVASPLSAPTDVEDAPSMLSLPPSSPNLAGSTHHRDKTFTVEVSNAHGYMCHTTVEAHWDLSHADMFALFSYPDNARMFRDLKNVGGRTVLSEEGCKRVVQVEQLGEMRVLWITRHYSTWLTVTEDWSDPDRLCNSFALLSSDLLTRFNGGWEFTPALKDGKVVGCNGVLHHDVLPKGVPSFLQHVPVLGGLLRGISMRAARRLLEDTNVAAAKIKVGHSKGRTTLDVLKELCGVFDPKAPPPATTRPIQSFALDVGDEDDSCSDTSDSHDQGIHHDAAGKAGAGGGGAHSERAESDYADAEEGLEGAEDATPCDVAAAGGGGVPHGDREVHAETRAGTTYAAAVKTEAVEAVVVDAVVLDSGDADAGLAAGGSVAAP